MQNTEVSSEASPPVADTRYRAFLETVAQLRPRLHRFCARMAGSVLDGEDIAQEALFEAYRSLDKFDSSRPLKPWLFQIAYNRSIDYLRKHALRIAAETASAAPDTTNPVNPARLDFSRAVEHLVISLPPKERACVLLKDVLDYSLEEIAEIVDSTPGGVKAALHRARVKLAAVPPRSRRPSALAPEVHDVIQLYVDRFNNHDWEGLRELIRADARLIVADAFAGKVADSPYFSNYERVSGSWKMTAAEVDGQLVVVRLNGSGDHWTAYSIIRVRVMGDRVEAIDDYSHCPWLISAAHNFRVQSP